MSKRSAIWVKLWWDWFTTASHLEISSDALLLGPVFMLFASKSPQKPWLLGAAGRPVERETIARFARVELARVEAAIEELIEVGTLIEDGPTGVLGFTPEGWARYQSGEDPNPSGPTLRQRVHRGKKAGEIFEAPEVRHEPRHRVTTRQSVSNGSEDLAEGVTPCHGERDVKPFPELNTPPPRARELEPDNRGGVFFYESARDAFEALTVRESSIAWPTPPLFYDPFQAEIASQVALVVFLGETSKPTPANLEDAACQLVSAAGASSFIRGEAGNPARVRGLDFILGLSGTSSPVGRRPLTRLEIGQRIERIANGEYSGSFKRKTTGEVILEDALSEAGGLNLIEGGGNGE